MGSANRPWLGIIAWLAFLAGLIPAVLVLAAPAGVWFGMWDYSEGLQMLFALGDSGPVVNSPGRWVGMALVIVAIALYLLARSLGQKNAFKLAALALIGAIIASASYYVPAQYLAGQAPPIHDVSTDTVNPPVFVDVLPLRADAPNTAVYGGSEGETPESLAAIQREAYPRIVPLELNESPQAAFERALSAAEKMGWDIVAAVPEDGRIEATATTFWFRFKDDVVIRIRPSTNGVIVDARSVSRVGRGDAGKNAQRLGEFLEIL